MHHFSWKVSHGPSIGRFNRLDEGFDQPCMNPEAPDPPPEAAAAGGSGPSKEQEKEPGAGAGGGGAPDYAALLQYLQFYQKQMEDNKK